MKIIILVILFSILIVGCQSGVTYEREYNESIIENIKLSNQLLVCDEENLNSNLIIESLNEKNQADKDFYYRYSIVLNNIWDAYTWYQTANTNFDVGYYYATEEDYDYDSAKSFFDISKSQTIDAKEIMLRVERDLLILQNKTSDEHYKEDIKLRLEYTHTFLDVLDNSIIVTESLLNELYEVNYGSEDTAKQYHIKANNHLDMVNKDLKILYNITNDIDMLWDQDWYDLIE